MSSRPRTSHKSPDRAHHDPTYSGRRRWEEPEANVRHVGTVNSIPATLLPYMIPSLTGEQFTSLESLCEQFYTCMLAGIVVMLQARSLRVASIIIRCHATAHKSTHRRFHAKYNIGRRWCVPAMSCGSLSKDRRCHVGESTRLGNSSNTRRDGPRSHAQAS